VNEILTCNFTGCARRTFVRSKYLEILSVIYQSLLSQPDHAASRSNAGNRDKIMSVASYLMSSPAAKDSVAQIARRVGMNRTKLMTVFKEVYGTSVEAYWRDCRLHHARELLTEPQLSISEISQKVGYSEISAFTRAFSKQFGMAPSKFRNN
jgi:AraC-like DNA-binding protein